MNKNKILIADDIEANRLICRDILRREFSQYEYEVFEDGKAIEKRLNGDVKDVRVGIIDHEMPGTYGADIIERYAPLPKYSGIKFILYSSDPSDEVKKRVENVGALFILKPIEGKTLVEAVREALEL